MCIRDSGSRLALTRCGCLNLLGAVLGSQSLPYIVWVRCQFELGKPGQRLLRRLAAHLLAWAQPDTHRRPVGLAKQPAAVVWRKLNAAHSGRLAVGHARDRRGNRRGDAAGAAAHSAIEGHGASIRRCRRPLTRSQAMRPSGPRRNSPRVSLYGSSRITARSSA